MFSIIIPYYNTKVEYFDRLLRSIDKQTVKPDNLELIIVDDHSKKSYRPKVNIDIPYTIIRNKRNHGPGYSRQRGIQYAKNDYVLFMDSDDEFVSPEAFAYYIDGIKENADIIYAKYILIEGSLQIRHSYHPDIWGQCIKKEFLHKYNIKFMDYIYGEDFLFSLHMYNKANKFYQIGHDVILQYYKNPGSLTDQEPSIFGAIVMLVILLAVEYAVQYKLDFDKVNYFIQGNIMVVKHIDPNYTNLFLSIICLVSSSIYEYTDAVRTAHYTKDPQAYRLLKNYIWQSLRILCSHENNQKRKRHLRFFKQCLQAGERLRRAQ